MKTLNFNLTRRVLSVLVALFAAVLAVGCDMLSEIPEPTITANVAASQPITTPLEVKATQGLKGKIEVTWQPVSYATRYLIFFSETQTGEFVQVGETTGTSFVDSVSSGSTFYYKIKAQKGDGSVSGLSTVAKGTSLATPAISGAIVERGNVTINWFMENARDPRNNSNNYVYDEKGAEILKFKLTCEGGGATKTVEVSGDTDSYTFRGLADKTVYYYQVSAYLTTHPDDIENSPKVTKETAQDYLPKTPEVAAAQGLSKSSIELEITLPYKVAVSTTSSTAAEKEDIHFPLYFSIERKLEAQGEASYTTVVPRLYYDGTTKEPSNYDAYTPGNKITWADTSASVRRGERYTYRVKAHTDTAYSKVIGSPYNSSNASTPVDVVGWKISEAILKVKDIQIGQSDDKQTNVSASYGFEASFDGMGREAEYSLVLVESRRGIASGNNGNLTKASRLVVYNPVVAASNNGDWVEFSRRNFNTIDEINKFTKNWRITEANQGVYRYSLAIFDKAAGDNPALSESLDEVFASNLVMAVYNNPNVTSELLEIRGGATDHISVTIRAEEGVNYRLERTNMTTNKSVFINLDVKYAYNGKYTYTDRDGLELGTAYSYTLWASGSNGVEVASNSLRTMTLSKPVIEINSDFAAYDTVSFTFDEAPYIFEGNSLVHKFIVGLGNNAYYGQGNTLSFDRNGKVLSTDLDAAPEIVKEGTQYKITLNGIRNSVDASKSGGTFPLVFTVVGENQISSDPVNVQMVGPGSVKLRGTETATLEKNAITIKWTGVQSAAGYAVFRTRPQFMNEPERTDVYYVSADGRVLKELRSLDSKPEICVSVALSNNEFTLRDGVLPRDPNTTSSWEVNQSRITWGLEYKYVVLPVLSEEDADVGNPSEFVVKYKNLAPVSGYTYGYGLEIEASKSDYYDKVAVKWNIPFYAQKNRGTFRLFYRGVGDNSWQFKILGVNDCTVKGTTATYLLEPGAAYRTRHIEVFVSYHTADTVGSYIDSSTYYKYISQKFDENKECYHWGYFFTLPNFFRAELPTKNNETFTETVHWPLFESEGTRAVGPDKYVLYVKNLNVSGDWKPLVEYDGKTFKDLSSRWYKVNVRNTVGVSITTEVTPEFEGSSHYGLLKVQRDYKHYYKIVAQRTNSEGDLLEASLGDDMSVYSYRKISMEEFTKGITLIFADSMWQATLPYHTTAITHWEQRTQLDGKEGYISFVTYRRWLQTYNHFTFGTGGEDYHHIFRAGLPGDTTNQLVSGWKISIKDETDITNTGRRMSGGMYCYYEIRGNPIKATHETGLPSYQGYVLCNIGNAELNQRINHTLLIKATNSSDEAEVHKAANTVCYYESTNRTMLEFWFPCAPGATVRPAVTSYRNVNWIPMFNNRWWDVYN